MKFLRSNHSEPHHHSQHTRSYFSSSTIHILFLLVSKQPCVIGSSGQHGSSSSSTLHLTPHSMSDRLFSTVSIHFPANQLHSMTRSISYLPILPCTWQGIRGKHQLVGSGSISHDPYSASMSSCFPASITSRQSRSNITPVLWQAKMEERHLCFERDV